MYICRCLCIGVCGPSSYQSSVVRGDLWSRAVCAGMSSILAYTIHACIRLCIKLEYLHIHIILICILSYMLSYTGLLDGGGGRDRSQRQLIRPRCCCTIRYTQNKLPT